MIVVEKEVDFERPPLVNIESAVRVVEPDIIDEKDTDMGRVCVGVGGITLDALGSDPSGENSML